MNKNCSSGLKTGSYQMEITILKQICHGQKKKLEHFKGKSTIKTELLATQQPLLTLMMVEGVETIYFQWATQWS